MTHLPFEECVFINCPFDEEYEPILQAILFAVVFLGFHPRISTERTDSGESRIEKIKELIEASKYSIHDLSRCQSTAPGQHFRLTMPFELGMDYACRRFAGRGRDKKKLLILEEERHRYLQAISDLSGCDIEAHAGNFEKAVRKVRNWLCSEAGAPSVAPKRILAAYADFQEWYYEKQLAAGFSEDDIQDYPTRELLEAMQAWINAGKPI